jgi:hypothetical protein
LFFEPTTGGGGGTETISVSPTSMSLKANGTQQFTATVTNGTGSPTWAITGVNPSGAAQGIVSSTGFYTAPSTVSVATTITITATAADGLASNTATVNLTPTVTGGSSTAVFVAPIDTTMEGSWIGVHGGDGYEIPNVGASLPSYATFAVQNATGYTWVSSTTDVRAVELPGGAGRTASTWFNPVSFSINVTITDGGTHQVALYALDWDNLGRNETIVATDAISGATLDSRTISSFSNGEYLMWNISGSVNFTINANTQNAVISGVFFGTSTGGGGGAESVSVTPSAMTLAQSATQQFTATVTNGTGTPAWTISNVSPSGAAQGTLSSTGFYTAPSTITVATTVTIKATAADGQASGTAAVTLNPPVSGGATAVFVAPLNTTTQGNWIGVYGEKGYEIPNVFPSLPAFASFTVNGNPYTWNGNPSDVRALDQPGGGSRIASSWFSPIAFNIGIDITDGGTHQVAFYALDWDNIGRNETITVSDAVSGALLDTRTLSSFSGGVYLVWNISGNVNFTITPNVQNAVISGVFFNN